MGAEYCSDLSHALDPIDRILGDHALDGASNELGNIGPKFVQRWRHAMDLLVDDGVWVDLLETDERGAYASEHFVERDPERVHVASRRHAEALQVLGAHVVDGSVDQIALGGLCLGPLELGDAEINDANLVVFFEEDILRL
jgi:hypothetical protein